MSIDIARRRSLSLVAAACGGLLTGGLARAQNSKTLKITVGFAPGGAVDITARILADGLRSSGYNAIVENKAGAGGRLALEGLKRLPADGTNLVVTPLDNLTIYPHIYRSLPYDPLKDLAVIAPVAGYSFGFAVAVSSKAKTLKEYLALAKADPSFASYGTPGAGTPMHFLGVMLARDAKVQLAHVPYRGGAAAITDVIGGTLPAMIGTLPALLPMQRAGRLRILAVSSAEPSSAVPGVPTFKSLGYPSLVIEEVFAVAAKAGTPPATVTDLNAAITAAMKTPAVAEALRKIELEPTFMSSAALDKTLRAEYDSWSKIVKATGYTADE